MANIKLSLDTQPQKNAIMACALNPSFNFFGMEITTLCLGVQMKIDSATVAELWAARLVAAAAFAEDEKTATELQAKADDLRASWRYQVESSHCPCGALESECASGNLCCKSCPRATGFDANGSEVQE